MNLPEDCGAESPVAPTLQPGSAGTLRTVGLLAALRNAWQAWLERGRQRRHLDSRSSHMLKDVGLARADIEFEMYKRPWGG
jgi:uncharacterized protein YjiS (DUF1127 family)